jgi:glucose-6-phosphate dehydrogenase assembly protein OpcA
MGTAGAGSSKTLPQFFNIMPTTLQSPPMAKLLPSKSVLIDQIPTALQELWQTSANALRANSFGLVIYEPAPIQQLLTALGFYDGPIDGINGPLTRDALAKSQQAYDLQITGKANEVTFAKLEEAYMAASKQNITPTAAEQNYRAADAIAEAGPSRIVTLCATNSTATELHAEVSAYSPIQKRQQSQMLGCEYVLFSGNAALLAENSHVVLDLLIPDLPLYVWWKGTPKVEQKLFTGLADQATHVIVDSATFVDSVVDFLLIPPLFAKGWSIIDINWQRIAPWQELTAATFDPPERRAAIGEIDEVEINFERGSSAQAWMYIAWLAGRLGWEPKSYQMVGGDYQLRQLEFMSIDGRLVKVELASMPIAEVGDVVGDLMGIKLASSNPKANCNTIICSETDGCMRMESGGKAQSGLVEQVNSLADQNAEQLVAANFHRANRDWLYEETMIMLSKILALNAG